MLLPNATTVHCGQRLQHLESIEEAICSGGGGHHILLWPENTRFEKSKRFDILVTLITLWL